MSVAFTLYGYDTGNLVTFNAYFRLKNRANVFLQQNKSSTAGKQGAESWGLPG